MTAIYSTLITKIKDTFSAVDSVKEVFNFPTTELTKYPSVIFVPAGFKNDYETGQENMKEYNFKAWIVIGATQTTLDSILSSAMPKVVDEVLARFDSDWNFETLNGHRVWSLIDTGQMTISEETAGLEVSFELNIKVKMLTNN